MLKYLIKYTNMFSRSKNQTELNILNATFNDVGFENFNNLKPIEGTDFENSTGIYFVSNSFSTSNIQKLLNLKLLNF